MTRPIGVGLIGAGPAAQAIHLPALARSGGAFVVRRVFDPDAEVASAVASRCGARVAADLDALLADPEVDVVVICSPAAFHADQVEAACAAGVRAVLCEKPLALDVGDARRVADASRRTGIPVVVGAMHLFDPAVVAARTASPWRPATHVASRILLPFNDRFEDWGTEVLQRPPRVVGIPDDRAAHPAVVRARLLGLAIHDLPFVRALLSDWREIEVVSAELLAPIGYAVTARTPSATLVLIGQFRDAWRPEWELVATAADGTALDIRFTPSYVTGGSAVARTTRAGRTTEFADGRANGYDGEWAFLARLVADPAAAAAWVADVDRLVDDLEFAVLVAERAAERMERG